MEQSAGAGESSDGQQADVIMDTDTPRSAHRKLLASPLLIRRAPPLPKSSPELDACLRRTFPQPKQSPLIGMSAREKLGYARSGAAGKGENRRQRTEVLDRLAALSMKPAVRSADLSAIVAARAGTKKIEERPAWANELLALVNSSPGSARPSPGGMRAPVSHGRSPPTPNDSFRERSFHQKRSPTNDASPRVGWQRSGYHRGSSCAAASTNGSHHGRCDRDAGCASAMRDNAWAVRSSTSGSSKGKIKVCAPPSGASAAPMIPGVAPFSRNAGAAVWHVTEHLRRDSKEEEESKQATSSSSSSFNSTAPAPMPELT